MNEYKRWKHAAWALVFIVIAAWAGDDEETEPAEDTDHDSAAVLSRTLRS